MLHLHTAARIEPLAAHLAAVCSDAPVDPMQREWIAVPAEGMRRWLNLELAGHLGASGPGAGDGIAANIEAAYPGSLRLRVLETGRPAQDPDPWRVERLAWSLLDVVQHAVSRGVGDRPGAGDALLAALVDLPPGGSRYGRMRRVAELFDRYHVHRPDMIRSWAAGLDVDGTGRQLSEHHRWQPHLWRLVSATLATPSPPQRLPDLLEEVRTGKVLTDRGDLPDRLMVFGLTVLPGGPDFLDLADAVASRREVHLFLLEPSLKVGPHVAARVRSRPDTGARFRSDDDTADLVAHPLLRSWGRLHRETAVLLIDAERRGLPAVNQVPDPPPRRNSPAAAAGETVLGRLQHDVRGDVAPSASLVPAAADRSVQFHACHGPTRQVQVLRDALLHLLADPSLALREDEILVVCPALERFAPTIEAVFGPSSDVPGTDRTHGVDQVPPLRYRIADRSIRSANPVLTAAGALLDLVGGRFEAPAVLDFISLAPVRARYRFTDDDVAQLSEWVTDTNVRWGLDAEHRESRGVPASIVNNTWRAATDRLMVGAAIYDDDQTLAIGDVAPHGIESDDVVVAGRLADVMWRLGEFADQTSIARPIGQWIELLKEMSLSLFSTPRDEEWQFEALLRVLGEINELSTSSAGPSVSPLEFVDLRRLLADQLAGTPGRPDFFRGGLTISSMTPLRWVPHRVVALLGMDQSAFGAGAVDGDDLTATNPLLGDRDTRAEARQALLESVLAAQERLVLVRDGHDVRTNQEVPPAVVVAELRDALLAMVDEGMRTEFAARLEIHHPRQPFDERAFVAGALTDSASDGGSQDDAAAIAQPWSFDGAALAGARARRERTTLPAPFITGRLPRDESSIIELASLHDFLRHPVRHFLQQQLGLRLPRREDGASALLPVGPSPLDRWGVGDRMLSALLGGSTVQDWARIERRLGTLPPGVLGEAMIDEVHDVVGQLVDEARDRGLRDGPPTSIPVDVQLPDGTRIVGAVLDRLQTPGAGPARVSFSSAKPEHRIFPWLDLMVLTAHDPTTDWHALGVNRVTGSGPMKLEVNDLSVLSPDGDRLGTATRALEVAVDCYRRGAAEPIPLFPSISRKIHMDEARSGDWFHNMDFGDGDDGGTALAYGHDFETLLSLPTLLDDPQDANSSESRVKCFAHYFWGAVDASVTDRDAPAGANAPHRVAESPDEVANSSHTQGSAV